MRLAIPLLLLLPACRSETTVAGSLPTESALTSDVAGRVAVVASSCFLDMPAERRLLDMYQAVAAEGSVDDLRHYAACIDAHRDGCRAISECLATTVSVEPAVTECSGGVAITSLGTRRVQTDCRRLGRTCQVVGALAECELPTPDGGVMRGTPRCTEHGLAAGSETCVGTHGSCPFDGKTTTLKAFFTGESCDGDELRACVASGLATLACGAIVDGARCIANTNGAYCGVGAACAPGAVASAQCDGDAVVVCNGGRIDRVDCKLLGFRSCRETQTALGEAYSACAE